MGVLSTFAGLAASFVLTGGRRLRRGPLRPDWSLLHEALFSRMKTVFAPMASLEPAAQRALAESQTVPTPVLRRLRIEPFAEGSIKGEWLTPKAGAPDRTVIYFHGGGYVLGSPATHRELAARLALAASARVLLLDYRLAPEHPFPAAIDDALAAVRLLRAQGVPMSRLVLAGDSAGGNLALVTLLSLREAGEPLPAGAALVCPWVDMTLTSRSIDANAPWDYLDRATAEGWTRHYLAGHDPRDPRCSPLFADLSRLPPLLIQVGTAEMLYDEGVAFAAKAGAANDQVVLREAPGMVHDWHLLAALLPEARTAIDQLGAFVREVTALPASASAPVDAAVQRIQG